MFWIINAIFFILPGFVGQVFVLAPGSSKSVWHWSVARKRKCNMSRKNTFDVIWYSANMIDIVSEWTYDRLDRYCPLLFILHMHWMIVSTHGLPPFQSYAEWPVNVDDLSTIIHCFFHRGHHPIFRSHPSTIPLYPHSIPPFLLVRYPLASQHSY
jgi:hypothetical protein